MPVIWDDAKEKQLLLLILHHTQPSPPWAEVAKGMGEDCSVEACRQKLKKLKAAAKTQFGDPAAAAGGAADGEGSAAPKTPGKKGKKAAGETPAKSTGKRKSKKEAEEVQAEEDDGEESPVKKLKTEGGEDSED